MKSFIAGVCSVLAVATSAQALAASAESSTPVSFVRANVVLTRSWLDPRDNGMKTEDICKASVQIPIYISADGSFDTTANPITLNCPTLANSGKTMTVGLRLANYLTKDGTPYASTQTMMIDGAAKSETANFGDSAPSNSFLKDVDAVQKTTITSNVHFLNQ